jgi:hypothetical protein
MSITSIRGIEIDWDDNGNVVDLRIIYNNETVSESVQTDPSSYEEMDKVLDKVCDFFGEVWESYLPDETL